MVVPWNLTGKRSLFAGSDIYVFSIAKSGRTWLRVLINKYLSLAFGVPFSLEDLRAHDQRIPSILFTHERWEHYRKTTFDQRLLGKYVIPEKMLRSKQVAVLYRDPRDVLVSLYFHMRKRSDRKTDKTLAELIDDRAHGLPLIVSVMNQWRKRLKNHPACFWISYEALKDDTPGSLSALLEFFKLPGIQAPLVEEAVAFAAFENMKKMEARGEFRAKIIRPGTPADPDSFKVRKGKVGGYRDHFSQAELARIEQTVAGLDPFFDYRPEIRSNMSAN